MAYALFSKKKKTTEQASIDPMSSIDIRTAAKAKAWVATLPMADMGEMTRRLYVGVSTLNRDATSPTDRIDATEVLLPYVQMVLENLDRHFFVRSLPLPERSSKIFELKQSLLMEVAGSYQLSSLEILTKKSISKKKALLSVGRAMGIMCQVLMNGYEVYAKPKGNLWHDLHHLYLLACENNFDTKKIPNNTHFNNADTIEEHYKLINLAALASPNTLRQGEIMRLREFFKATLKECAIVSNADKIQGKYAHIALMNSDEPATLMPIADLVSSQTSRVFDLSKVIARLEQFSHLSAPTDLGTHDSWPMLTHSLSMRLIHTLTTIKNRRYKRFPREEKATLVIRMVDVLEIIRENEVASFSEQLNQDMEDDNIYEALTSGEQVSSPWSEVDTLAEDRDIKLHTWNISNSSTGGYGFSQIKNESSMARVGELIAIKDEKDESESWQVAAIRWLDAFSDKGLRMGVEILSLQSTTVTVEKILNREITQKLPLEGIVLPKIEGAREESNLIFPGFIFHVDDEIVMTINSQPQQVRITSVDDTIGSFSYCSYEDFETENAEEGSVESFDEVWEFL